MPPVVDGDLTEIGQPNHYMRCADAYFVIAARAAVGFERSGSGYRAHLVVVSVRPGLYPTRDRQRPERLLPTR
jgi:hypothetical protein